MYKKYKRLQNNEIKIAIAFHDGLSSTLDKVKAYIKEYTFSLKTNKFHLGDITYSYERHLEIFKDILNQERKNFTIFHNAFALLYVLKKYESISIISNEELPNELETIHDKFIIETTISYLHYSTYSIDNNEKKYINLLHLNEELEKELNTLKNNLLEIIKSSINDFDLITNILKEIFLVGIASNEDLELNDIKNIENHISFFLDDSRASNSLSTNNTLYRKHSFMI